MKELRKWLCLSLAVMMVFAMTACGGGDSGSGDSSASSDVNELAVTPYSDGPQEINEIVEKMVSEYDLADLSDDDKNYEINLGYYNCDHMAAAAIGDYTGIYEALGMKVKVTGNGNVPEAMAAGQMDMGYVGWTTTLSAVQNNVPLFYACENHTGGSEYLVVTKDINEPSDLIGKKISIGTDPETTNMNWAEWTRKLDIPLDASKYETFDMKDSDEFLAMQSGELDGYICCDPWASMAEYADVGKIMIRQDTDRPDGHGTCCKVIMNRNFADAHPALAERMLLAHTLCVQFMYEHPYYAAEVFSAYYNVPIEVALKTYWRKFCEEGRTIRWDLNREYMDNQLKEMQKLGVRDDINTLNLDDFIDLSFFENCGAKDFNEFIATNIEPVFPEDISFEEYKEKAYAIDGVNPEDVPEYSEFEKKE